MKKIEPKRQGKLLTNGVILTSHEQRTINFLLSLDHDIELIRPSFKPKSKTPDFIMNGLEWEMKCPEGKSKLTIEHIIRKASHQSKNVIIDLQRLHITENVAIRQIKYELSRRPSIKNLWIITKNKTVIIL